MTKKEVEKIKKEIKQEIKAEIIDEIKLKMNKNQNGASFDFNEYKAQVVDDDIKKVEDFINKNKGYGYIPIVGTIVYSGQMGQAFTSIDRGILRKNINKASLKGLGLDIPFTYLIPLFLIINYGPFKMKSIIKKAIKITKRGSEE